jgi:hypothetical protein
VGMELWAAVDSCVEISRLDLLCLLISVEQVSSEHTKVPCPRSLAAEDTPHYRSKVFRVYVRPHHALFLVLFGILLISFFLSLAKIVSLIH